MAIKLLGFKIGRDKEDVPEERLQPFSIPENLDAAITVESPAMAGAYGTYLDLEGTVKTEIDLITRYREMAMNPEVELAVDDIINEAVITENGKSPVSISLGNIDIPESIKNKIIEEFDEVLRLLAFNDYAYDIFKRWYVDGRIYYHVMIDTKNPKEGIQELRSIDPRQIKKIREVKGKRLEGNSLISLPQNMTEYYLFYPGGIAPAGPATYNNASTSKDGLKIAYDSISHIHSGILDPTKTMILGNLHKAIKPMNQLKMLEDATVIYRISRAPERRIFYIDVGNLPKLKAEQYLHNIMAKYKNKLMYDSATGEVRDDRHHMAMTDDFWLPRREGGRGTEITTLPGGTNLGEIEDIIYFKKKLYKALGVPVSRLEPEGSFSLGRATEITRDEVKFGKFVNRLRYRFSTLFDDLLGKQLQLKGILSKNDWDVVRTLVEYNFRQDSHFAELKQIEIMRERVETAQNMDDYVGQYYSKSWLRKNVLMQTEEDIRQIDKEVEKEEAEGEEENEFDASGNDGDNETEETSAPQQQQQQQEESISPSKRFRTIKLVNSKTKIPVMLDD
ncbi:MAG TPA: portal protein [Flavobacteriales bacterium]|nr:portal protein [Flavobacteriales bacterium]